MCLAWMVASEQTKDLLKAFRNMKIDAVLCMPLLGKAYLIVIRKISVKVVSLTILIVFKKIQGYSSLRVFQVSDLLLVVET